MSEIARWAAGAGLAIVTAALARALGWLSVSGAIAAAAVGTLAVGAGWDWGVVLLSYFAASSALSRIGRREREARTAGRIEKAGARDAVQVVANGGVFAIAAMAFALGGSPLWYLVAAAGLAASAADTWATEIGTLARSAARSIVTGRLVPAGTSGGVTVQGSMAGIAGAAFVGGTAAMCGWPASAVNAAVIGGVAGCLADSLLGASAQSRRWCPSCRADTEQRVHRCGAATQHRSGVRWLDNDAVNAVSTVLGAAIGTLVASAA